MEAIESTIREMAVGVEQIRGISTQTLAQATRTNGRVGNAEEAISALRVGMARLEERIDAAEETVLGLRATVEATKMEAATTRTQINSWMGAYGWAIPTALVLWDHLKGK
jgi:chromosome segregation ATPase